MNPSNLIPACIAELKEAMLPDPDEISYYVLENKRKIFMDFDIGEDVSAIERLIMRWNIEDKDKPVEDRAPIWIYIMSYGGDLDWMWSLIDCIEMSDTPVYTVNMGIVGSAASLIFLAGNQRYMMPRSKLIIHEGHAELSGDAVKVMDASEAYRKDLKRMKEFVEQHSQIPHSAIMKKRNNDWYLDAQYCLDNGACDYIISSLSEVCL